MIYYWNMDRYFSSTLWRRTGRRLNMDQITSLSEYCSSVSLHYLSTIPTTGTYPELLLLLKEENLSVLSVELSPRIITSNFSPQESLRPLWLSLPRKSRGPVYSSPCRLTGCTQKGYHGQATSIRPKRSLSLNNHPCNEFRHSVRN